MFNIFKRKKRKFWIPYAYPCGHKHNKVGANISLCGIALVSCPICGTVYYANQLAKHMEWKIEER